MRLTKKLGVLSGALILSIGAGGIALASIPDSDDGEIHACRVTGDAGNTRIIDKQAGASCHSYEEEVTWQATTKVDTVLATQDVNWSGPVLDVNASAVCPSTHPTVTGGGWKVSPSTMGIGDIGNVNAENYPILDNTGDQDAWHVRARYSYGASIPAGAKVTVYAVCTKG